MNKGSEKKLPSKGNQPRNAYFIFPNLSKEENEKKRQNLLDVMERIVVYDLNNSNRQE